MAELFERRMKHHRLRIAAMLTVLLLCSELDNVPRNVDAFAYSHSVTDCSSSMTRLFGATATSPVLADPPSIVANHPDSSRIKNEKSKDDDEEEEEYEEDDGTDGTSSDEDDEDNKDRNVGTEMLEKQRKRLLLMNRINRNTKSGSRGHTSSVADRRKNDNSGKAPRRELSAASRAARSSSMPSSSAILKGIRNAAAAAAKASKNKPTQNPSSDKNDDAPKAGLSSMTKATIQSTVANMLRTQKIRSVPTASTTTSVLTTPKQLAHSYSSTEIAPRQKSPHEDPFGMSHLFHQYKLKQEQNEMNYKKSMGVFGEPVVSSTRKYLLQQKKTHFESSGSPGFGYVLLRVPDQVKRRSLPFDANGISSQYLQTLKKKKLVAKVASSSYNHQRLVRVATPRDDIVIANLRMSVFSGFNNEMRKKFCLKSCQVLHSRRLRGATCLVATCRSPTNSQNNGDTKEIVLGSAECSTHEFINTELGTCRPGASVMYVTEFAVHPQVRGTGAGTLLLQGIDELAKERNVETLYLHVDVTNEIACHMYQKAGYIIAGKNKANNRMYQEFTTSLNLQDGATKGRKHYLMYKHIVNHPTWLHSPSPRKSLSHHGLSKKKSQAAKIPVLGFQI